MEEVQVESSVLSDGRRAKKK